MSSCITLNPKPYGQEGYNKNLALHILIEGRLMKFLFLEYGIHFELGEAYGVAQLK